MDLSITYEIYTLIVSKLPPYLISIYHRIEIVASYLTKNIPPRTVKAFGAILNSRLSDKPGVHET
ncbi:hypothetical protein OSTOST_13111 [Ostertagia ostertagi]